MGTLREHTMYSSALSCSDQDYPSSSEQSCDTVIYVGANGRMLSDRELTDNEGPPPPTIMFRPSPLTCRRGYGGSKSSGDEGVGSADGRSTLSDGDGYPRKSTAPKCGASVLYSRFARNKGAADSGTLERTKLRTKAHMSPKHRGVDVNAPEQWVDGPAASGATYVPCAEAGGSARTVNVHKSPQRVEQWVDGPNAAGYSLPSNPVEQWIDGPATQTQVVQTQRLNAELWVDGPRAFRLDRGQADGSTPDPPCERSNLSSNTLDVGSTTSLAVEPDSRPVSMQGVDPASHHVADMTDLCGGEAQNDDEGTSSFVRDWLDKHGAVPSSDPSRSPHHQSSRKGIERGKSSRQHPSLDEMLFGETNRKCEKSPASERKKPTHRHKTVPSKPDASPAPSRHSEASHASRHLSGKCAAPSGASNRTAAWVESVQQSISAVKSSGNGPGFEMTPEFSSRIAAVVARTGDSSGTTDGSVEQCNRLGDECDNGASATCTSAVDAVSISQLATEAVTMADEGTQCVSLQVTEEPRGCVTDPSTGRCEVDHVLAPVAEESTTSVSDGCDLNHRSIYEFQNDDRLELARCGESLSCIAQDNVDSFKRQLLDVCNDDITKTVASVTLATPSENGVLSQDCFDKNNDSCLLRACYDTVPPISSEESKNSTNRRPVPPSCLRRPDGASNPNLSTTDPVKPLSHSPEYLQSPVQILSASKSPVFHSDETNMSYAFLNRTVEGECCPDNTNLNSSKSSDLPPKSPGRSSTPRKLSRPSVLPKPDPRCATVGGPREKPQVPARTSSMQKSSCCFDSEARTKPPTPVPSLKLQKECVRTTDCAPSSKSPTSRLPSLSNFVPMKIGHHSSRSSTSPKHPGNSHSTPASKTSSSSSKSPSKTNNHKSASPSRTSHVTSKLTRFMGMRSSGVEDAHKGRSSSEPNQKKDKRNKQLLSPYSVVSKARSLSFSGASSGHGSGSSSGKGSSSYQATRNARGKAEGTSSGYESMRRDSEVTGTSSSPHDSTSESSSGGRTRVTKTQKKKITRELILNFTFTTCVPSRIWCKKSCGNCRWYGYLLCKRKKYFF